MNAGPRRKRQFIPGGIQAKLTLCISDAPRTYTNRRDPTERSRSAARSHNGGSLISTLPWRAAEYVNKSVWSETINRLILQLLKVDGERESRGFYRLVIRIYRLTSGNRMWPIRVYNGTRVSAKRTRLNRTLTHWVSRCWSFHWILIIY